jgi:hypothetical protein
LLAELLAQLHVEYDHVMYIESLTYICLLAELHAELLADLLLPSTFVSLFVGWQNKVHKLFFVFFIFWNKPCYSPKHLGGT